MDDKTVLRSLLQAHSLLRHDFMNTLQVISGYQQIGQPDKAGEYMERTTALLRRFSSLGKIEAPMLEGLLISYLTKYADYFPAFEVKAEGRLQITPDMEADLAGILDRVMALLEQYLVKKAVSCRIQVGSRKDGALSLILEEGDSPVLRELSAMIAPILKGAHITGEIGQWGDNVLVNIRARAD